MVDPRFERSVRRWLVAYPPRWRWQRADEVVGVLADLADLAGPGATRLGLRAGLGLLVGGLATRRRTRPPFAVRLRFWFGLGGVPARYRGWVADEIAGPMFQWQVFALVVAPQVMLQGWRFASGGGRASDLAWWVVWAVLLFVMPRTRARRDAASRYLVARPGEAPTPWDVRPGWVYRDRLTARSALVPGCVAAVTATGVAAVATVLTRSGSLVALATCLGLGLLVAGRLAARWRRWLPARPDQPARVMVTASRRAVASIWCWAAFLALPAWGETSPLPPASGASLAPILLGAGLLVLPALLVAAAGAARGPGDLAAVDVWRLLVGRGPLRADTLPRGVVPASFGRTAPADADPPPVPA